MIEWEKMSNFAAGNKSYSASTTPLGTYSDSSKTRTRQVRSTSVSSPFRILERDKPHDRDQSFGEVMTMVINGEPWFVGKDVATILGYKDIINALKSHVDSEDKLGWQITTSGQRREVTFINESGLYSLILSSKLPQAKEFKRWVTLEVLG